MTCTFTSWLLKASFRYAAPGLDKIVRALKPVYTAPTEDAATSRFLEICEEWGQSIRRSCGYGRTPGLSSYPSCSSTRRSAGSSAPPTPSSRSTPYPPGCPGTRPLPLREPALKCIYLTVMSLDPTGTGRKRWTSRWRRALQAFDATFDGRLTNNRI